MQLRFLNKGKIFKTAGKNLRVGLFNSADFSLCAKGLLQGFITALLQCRPVELDPLAKHPRACVLG
jgi:hypothetical protein